MKWNHPGLRVKEMDRGLCRSCYLLSAHLFPAHFFYIYILGNSKFSFFTSSYYNMNISIPKTFVESFMVTVLKNLLVHQLLGISNYNFFIYLCNAKLILMALRKKWLTKSFDPPLPSRYGQLFVIFLTLYYGYIWSETDFTQGNKRIGLETMR